jgi:nitroreductase
MQDVLKLIQERQSTRGLFEANRHIPSQDLKKILEAGRWAPTAHNMQNFGILVVDDKPTLASIGAIKLRISETFIRENYQQLSPTVEVLQKKKVGLLATMFPPFMRTPDAPPEGLENSFLGKLIQTGPVLLLVLFDPSHRAPASEGDFLGIISLGCAMENMWLMAQSLGIGVHIISSLSEEAVEKELKRLLAIPDHLKIAFSMRLGYPAASTDYLRIRRDVEDFTHRNRYGNK